MSGSTLPTTGPTRIGRVPLLVCVAAVVSCGIWGAWPVDRTPIPVPAIASAANAPGAAGPTPLELAAFRVPLWVAPPATPPAVAAAPPPPPLKLQLIGILTEHGEYRAALYDPDTDRITIVGPGDMIAGRRVERVGKSEAVLLDGSLARTLALRTEEGRP